MVACATICGALLEHFALRLARVNCPVSFVLATKSAGTGLLELHVYAFGPVKSSAALPPNDMSDDAGAAFWQYTYIAGRDDENQVLFNESTWKDIIKPAADKTVQAVQSRPVIANCVPGDLTSSTVVIDCLKP